MAQAENEKEGEKLSGHVLSLSKPVAAVGDPPAEDANGNRGAERPPQRKKVIGRETQDGENEPEDFSLHAPSVAETRD